MDKCSVCVANYRCPFYNNDMDTSDVPCDEVIARTVNDERDEYMSAWYSYVSEYEDFDDVDKSAEIDHILSSLF